MGVTTEAGFYDGTFRQAGEALPDTATPLSEMTKAELLAEAERRGIEVKDTDTKAEIVATLGG